MQNIVIDTNNLIIKESTQIVGFESVPLFRQKLYDIGLFPLKPLELEILQINLGYMCNQTCNHCHVDAGPTRNEIMTRETMEMCLDVLDNSKIKTVDLTGGAPEMNPNFKWFVSEIRKKNIDIIVRTNLTILVSNSQFRTFPEFFKLNNVQVVSSLPCYTKENVDKQRGNGVFEKSIEVLINLNKLGYGKKDSGLELNLVYNPGGAFLPGSQVGLQKDYKERLFNEFGIEFNNLYTITNLPVNRFLDYLKKTGKYEKYMITLTNAFNPSAAMGVMCRNTVSVGWNGKLYDCDFNQMLDLPVDVVSSNIEKFSLKKLSIRKIVLGQHCYGCTAGEGSSCQGAIVNRDL